MDEQITTDSQSQTNSLEQNHWELDNVSFMSTNCRPDGVYQGISL